MTKEGRIMKKKISPPTEMVSPVFSMSINEQEVFNLTGLDYHELNWHHSKNKHSEPFFFGEVFQGEWANNWAPVDLIENPPK